MKIQKYGYIPDLPDQRDFTYKVVNSVLPERVDLHSKMPAVYDQGQLGSCTANAIAGIFEYLLTKDGLPSFVPSRLLIYYDERTLEGTISSDSGAQIRDGIKVVANSGVVNETLWPYDINKFAVKPPESVVEQALKNKALKYTRLDNTQIEQLKDSLHEGLPFVMGFSVYESFESPEVAKTGLVPMPKPNEQCLGGHAVAVVGYDDRHNYFIVRNSWGPDWGVEGYFFMPYEYVTNANLCSDFWNLDSVS
jgi:C1A family cysteine protease